MLVIYMGMAQIRTIVDGLLAVLPPELPAAVVQHASSARERSVLASWPAVVHRDPGHGRRPAMKPELRGFLP